MRQEDGNRSAQPGHNALMQKVETSSKPNIAGVERYETCAGRQIYRLRVEVFPGFSGNAYLVDDGDQPILVDCGSGQPQANLDLDRRLAEVGELGRSIGWSDLRAVVLTHGHIDHFGGLSHLRHHTDAPVLIHALDRRLLTGYQDQLLAASRRIDSFFADAGIDAQRRRRYMELYKSMKGLFTSVEVDELVAEGPILGGALEAIATPGHCPGHVCLRVDDVLLTGDLVLAAISPNIWPETITPSTGLLHYLESLDRVTALPDIRLGLGGHGGPIDDIAARAQAIRAEHSARLESILELCAEPRTVAELSKMIFGEVRSYHILLAILETGALVEYLELHGELLLTNVAELELPGSPALRYQKA